MEVVILEELVLLFVMVWRYLLAQKCFSFQLSFEDTFMGIDIQKSGEIELELITERL